MNASIPSGTEIKALLKPLGYAELREIARQAAMPVSTLYAIRDHVGAPNPGIDTVRRFWPYLPT